MPNNKTPLEQFEEKQNELFRLFRNDEINLKVALKVAARQLVVSELEGLKREQYGNTPIWIAQSEINKVIKRYKPSLLELPESEQQAIYEKTAKESTKLQQDVIKQYNGGGDEESR